MINISGRLIESSIIRDLSSSHKIIGITLNRMNVSNLVFNYSSLPELEFELKLRVSIINASRAMDKSNFSFEIFRKSKCNSEYWTRTNEGGFLLDDNVLPSDAINDIFINSSKYATECATAIVIIYYKALLDVLGKNIFNRLFIYINLMNWHYLDDKIGIYSKIVEGSSLPGDCCYFKNPDVNPLTPEWQGENAIDLGDETYFGHGIGINTAIKIIEELNENRKKNSTKSAYLTKSITTPDFKQLAKIYFKISNHQ